VTQQKRSPVRLTFVELAQRFVEAKLAYKAEKKKFLENRQCEFQDDPEMLNGSKGTCLDMDAPREDRCSSCASGLDELQSIRTIRSRIGAYGRALSRAYLLEKGAIDPRAGDGLALKATVWKGARRRYFSKGAAMMSIARARVKKRYLQEGEDRAYPNRIYKQREGSVQESDYDILDGLETEYRHRLTVRFARWISRDSHVRTKEIYAHGRTALKALLAAGTPADSKERREVGFPDL